MFKDLGLCFVSNRLVAIHDGVPYFDDLYLDLVIYPDGTILTNDMDELEKALAKKDITREQYDLAIETKHKLQGGILTNINVLTEYTEKCYNMVI